MTPIGIIRSERVNHYTIQEAASFEKDYYVYSITTWE